jgi:hypothetical protein
VPNCLHRPMEWHVKTIADFRRDNRNAFRPVFRQFVLLCREMDLLVLVQNSRTNTRVSDAPCRVYALSTAFQTAGAAPPRAPRRRSPNCPLRMRCISSIPAIVIAA